MSFLDRFKRGGGILCPRCEKSVDGHDEEKCARAMTRRHFVGMWGAAVAIAYGGGKVILATPSHVKAIEKEAGGEVFYLAAAKNGRIVSTSFRGQYCNASHIDADGKIHFNTRAEEALKLRAHGFHVGITSDLAKHQMNYKTAYEASLLPAVIADNEFPSVYKW